MKKQVENRLVINVDDGTVTGFDGTVVVDPETLDPHGKELLEAWDETHYEGHAKELGFVHGTPLVDRRKNAVIIWCDADIQQLKPEWSLNKCQEFLDRNARHIQDRLIETGWEVLESLINSEE